jgi:UDP-N-acetylglucosamine acyltransferase
MIHPTAVVDSKARIGEDVEIGPHSVVGPESVIGDRCRLFAHVVIGAQTTLGSDNEVHPGAVLGGPPQDQSFAGEPTAAEIGSHNIFREHVTVNRGTVKGGGITRVGDHNLLMAAIHVGHDCQLGSNLVLANGLLLAGHVQLQDRCNIGGHCGLHHFTRVGQMAFIAGGTPIEHDVPPFTIVDNRTALPRALNVVGLRRGGVSEEEIRELRAHFKLLFRSDEPIRRVLEQSEPTAGSLSQVLHDFMSERMQSPSGRYLESFRRDGREVGR